MPESSNGSSGPPSGSSETETPRTFTQEEVNRIAAQAREEGRRTAARRENEPRHDANAASSAGGGEQFERYRAAYEAGRRDELVASGGAHATVAGLKRGTMGGVVGAPGYPVTPAASTGAAPRRVDDFRDEGGLIDVFALSPEQTLTMGPHRIREEFEKALARQREMSGAPPIPAVLRRK